METYKKLNIAVILIVFVLGIVLLLVINDHPLSWKIPESFILGSPLLFLLALILSIISIRNHKNKTAIVTCVISSIFLALTLLAIIYLISFTYGH